jgi:hypothetical protein
MTDADIAAITAEIVRKVQALKRQAEADLAEYREIAEEVRKRRAARCDGGGA